MLGIIFLIFGIIYACRRPTVKRLTSEQFPNVPSEKFLEWKTLELKSIDMFLWATAVFFAIVIIYSLLPEDISGDSMVVPVILFIGWLGMLTMSAIPGSKASKLKKQFAIINPVQPPSRTLAPPSPAILTPPGNPKKPVEIEVPCPKCRTKWIFTEDELQRAFVCADCKTAFNPSQPTAPAA